MDCRFMWYNLPNRIKILWRPHPDQRIQYYRIEKFNTTLNEWIHLILMPHLIAVLLIGRQKPMRDLQELHKHLSHYIDR